MTGQQVQRPGKLKSEEKPQQNRAANSNREKLFGAEEVCGSQKLKCMAVPTTSRDIYNGMIPEFKKFKIKLKEIKESVPHQ